ncbi:hypothetical protein [Inhella gelatinilytica]|uniref:Uncharacterized protein n=1 Tax=Inhella gelatinilytica TaxID=2795030 RepID=A0A931IYI4_9BURK|nr:hypothetical protein [Inhella gelatinilytica]MBH9553946.1 hypothetical protein [Inhella gelatinilytica]
MLQAVIAGAFGALSNAFALLKQPNPTAIGMQEELSLLHSACAEEYAKRSGLVDAPDGLAGRLRATPAWSLLSRLGLPQPGISHPAATVAGMELMLSLHRGKVMAASFCNGVRLALEEEALNLVSLESLLSTHQDEKPPHWIKHARTIYADFFSAFDETSPQPLPPRSFEDRARTELACRAAFATYRRRAGVLDDTCLSRRQIAEAVGYAGTGVFRSPAEREAALWIIGMSGLFGTSTQFIPLATAAPEDWVISYDLAAGVLRRDYSSLVPEAARPRPGVGTPASYIATTPAPARVAEELKRRALDVPGAYELGDLIPALRQISPRDLVHPDLADLGPSFARWSRTLAPLSLQVGLDTLLAGVICGDLGVTARSKLHYCLIGADELWGSAARLYAVLGWDRPVAQPSGSLPFGAAVVPTASALAQLDEAAWRWVEAVRPPKRLGHEALLLEFHNRFVRALSSRLAVWVSLRPAAELSLRAVIQERFDLCVDLLEKSSAGRVGALPAVICDGMRAALMSYREHCKALLERLRTFGWSGPVVAWLMAVIKREDVPLLCTIHGRNNLVPQGTNDLRKTLPGALQLPADWGRKFMENQLRQAGAQSRDIDRHQRHEVIGQEQDTSIADSCEMEWVLRLKPILDRISRQLFRSPLTGLRTGGVAT